MSIYLKLIWAYLKISIFGFGGGYAMLSLIRHEIVDRGWIAEHMFTDIVAISQMTPGPIGINSATYIGYTVGGGVMGSMVTTRRNPPVIPAGALHKPLYTKTQGQPLHKGHFCRVAACRGRTHRLCGIVADEPRELRRPVLKHRNLCRMLRDGLFL